MKKEKSVQIARPAQRKITQEMDSDPLLAQIQEKSAKSSLLIVTQAVLINRDQQRNQSFKIQNCEAYKLQTL